MSETLTISESAAVAGLAENTLRAYIVLGKVSPVPQTGRGGKKTLFYRTEIEKLSSGWDSYQDRRKARRDAIEASGMRLCTGCGDIAGPKPFSEFRTYPAGIGGRHSRCIACQNESARIFAQVHREARCAYKREYRQREREKIKAYKRQYERRVTQEKGQTYEKRCAYQRRYQSWWRKLIHAIDSGKTSPICRRTGFSIVVSRERNLRAARLDKPIESGETALVHYEWGPAINRWIVLPPPITNRATQRITALCLKRETKPTRNTKRGEDE